MEHFCRTGRPAPRREVFYRVLAEADPSKSGLSTKSRSVQCDRRSLPPPAAFDVEGQFSPAAALPAALPTEGAFKLSFPRPQKPRCQT
jgi:hypothetical protein